VINELVAQHKNMGAGMMSMGGMMSMDKTMSTPSGMTTKPDGKK
jgi:hypothetical protein